MDNDVYVDFAGWFKLDPSTLMEYIDDDEKHPSYLSVREWIQLPKSVRSRYLLHDFVEALRNSEEFEFCDISIQYKEVVQQGDSDVVR